MKEWKVLYGALNGWNKTKHEKKKIPQNERISFDKKSNHSTFYGFDLIVIKSNTRILFFAVGEISE